MDGGLTGLLGGMPRGKPRRNYAAAPRFLRVPARFSAGISPPAFVIVGINDVQTWWIVKEFTPPLFVPEGGVVSTAIGELGVLIS